MTDVKLVCTVERFAANKQKISFTAQSRNGALGPDWHRLRSLLLVKGWLECTARRWAEASGRALCRYKSVAVPVRREVGTQTISSEREVGNAAGRLATNLAPEASLPSMPLQSVSGSHSLPLQFS